jgi:CBS domain-containing protein
MQVRNLMHREIFAVRPDQTLRDAAAIMHEHEVGSAVVLEDDQLAGILTERDVLRAVATGTDPGSAKVAEFMSRDVVAAAPNWDVAVAASEMTTRHFRHLVVREHNQVLGVVSVRDLLPVFLSNHSDDA